ncbi:DNA topoisomerase 1 [Pelomyxa schiedti]|nr:DNA topoisomerase 1 [Pelomyxa schiedti]
MLPSFTLHLNTSIQPGRATIGKFDGVHPSLACSTTGGKVFVHTPFVAPAGTVAINTMGNQFRFLNVNEKVTALASGCFAKLGGSGKEPAHDVLLVGTPSNLLAFDVERNQDIFFKEVDDGVNVICMGTLGESNVQQAIVGGNCNIQGFDGTGEEQFFTVTGDNVTSMGVLDFNSDGTNELIVGSEDFDIRAFSSTSELLAEVNESNVVTGLCPLYGSHFGFSLSNGIVGLYDKTKRIWRVKSRHKPVSLCGMDFDQDGVAELVSGWTNGRFEVRSDRTGDLVFKDTLDSPIAAVLSADYRMTGTEELIVCSQSGEVRGYTPLSRDAQGGSIERTQIEESLIELNQKRQQLLSQLKSYEDAAAGSSSTSSTQNAIPPIRTLCKLTFGVQCIQLEVGINSSDDRLLIHGLLLFSETVFPSGNQFVHFKEPCISAVVPLQPPKDSTEDLNIKLLVGHRNAEQYIVIDLVQRIPKFSMFAPTSSAKVKEPVSVVEFQIQERVNRFWLWLQQSFLIESPHSAPSSIDMSFVHLRDNTPLRLIVVDGRVTLKSDDIALAGALIQDLCSFLNVTSLESTATMSDEITEQYRRALQKVEEYQAVRVKLTAEMAESATLIKALLIQAEDSRLLNEMKRTKEAYSSLFEVNEDLIREYRKRESNYNALLSALKDLNLLVQHAANLRVGPPKKRITAASREAINANNAALLIKIIKLGY